MSEDIQQNTDEEVPNSIQEPVEEPKSALFQNKNMWLIGLLALCNLIAAITLGSFEPPAEVRTADLNTIDVAIEEKLREYNIPTRQIRTENVLVDSQFTRKIIRSGIPKGVSRTLVHLELNQELAELGVKIPGVVKFPERDLNLHFMLGETIVRTLVLRTDTALKVLSYPASIIFYSDSDPDSDALFELASFGEIFQVAGRIESLKDADSFFKEVKNANLHRTLVWVQGSEMPGFKYDRFYNELTEKLRKTSPSSKMLLFSHAQTSNNRALWKTMNQQEWTVVLAKSESIQTGGQNEEEFLRMLSRFNNDALTASNDVLILPMRTNYVVWLKKHLTEFKKEGLRLVELKPIKI